MFPVTSTKKLEYSFPVISFSRTQFSVEIRVKWVRMKKRGGTDRAFSWHFQMTKAAGNNEHGTPVGKFMR